MFDSASYSLPSLPGRDVAFRCHRSANGPTASGRPTPPVDASLCSRLRAKVPGQHRWAYCLESRAKWETTNLDGRLLPGFVHPCAKPDLGDTGEIPQTRLQGWDLGPRSEWPSTVDRPAAPGNSSRSGSSGQITLSALSTTLDHPSPCQPVPRFHLGIVQKGRRDLILAPATGNRGRTRNMSREPRQTSKTNFC